MATLGRHDGSEERVPAPEESKDLVGDHPGTTGDCRRSSDEMTCGLMTGRLWKDHVSREDLTGDTGHKRPYPSW